MNDGEQPKKSRRGFAAMSPEKRREIASKGGKSVDPQKRSFAQNRDLASTAGRKGGVSVAPDKRSFAQNRDLAVSAGTKGGASVRKAKP